jgi:hypothetical protein
MLEEDESDANSDEEEEQDTEVDEVLTMQRVRFNSVCILPSQIDCCSLENYEKNNDR